MRAHLRLMDGFRLDVDGTERLLPPAAQRLVALLGLSTVHCRAEAAGRLWPEFPDDRALGNLRSALWRVERAVPHLLVGGPVLLRLADDVTVDVRQVLSWSRAAIDTSDPQIGPPLPPELATASLLPGWYDDWVISERDEVQQLRQAGLEVFAERLLCAGRTVQALQAAYAAARIDPLRESAQRLLVRVHLAQGNVADALRVHDTFKTMLLTELGVLPSEQMSALLEGLRRVPRAPGQGSTRPALHSIARGRR